MRLDSWAQNTTRQNHTLRVALLISAIDHGAVFYWLEFERYDGVDSNHVSTIDITLIKAVLENEPEIEEPLEPAAEAIVQTLTREQKVPAQEVDTPPAEVVVASEVIPDDVDPVPAESVDLQELISSYAESAAMENVENEEHRDEMWRKTFSVMFAPPEEWIKEDEPYLPDLQFETDKPRVLGIKIGENCYLGFPGIDPQTVDSDAPGWSGGGAPQPTLSLISCGFGK